MHGYPPNILPLKKSIGMKTKFQNKYICGNYVITCMSNSMFITNHGNDNQAMQVPYSIATKPKYI